MSQAVKHKTFQAFPHFFPHFLSKPDYDLVLASYLKFRPYRTRFSLALDSVKIVLESKSYMYLILSPSFQSVDHIFI
jgi:hypothetical protein